MARKYQPETLRRPIIKVDIPSLNQFIYSAVYNAASTVKASLPPPLNIYVSTPERLKAFLRKSNLENKMLLMTQLGFKSCLQISPIGRTNMVVIASAAESVANGKHNEALEKLISDGIYVVSDKQVLAYNGLAANLIHSPIYTLNLSYTKTRASKWPQDIDTDRLLIENEQIDRAEAELISCSFSFSEMVKEYFGITQLEMMVLLVFYARKNKYLPNSYFDQYFVKQARYFNKSVAHLLAEEMIQENPVRSKEREYSISSFGIKTVLDYKRMIYKKIQMYV